SRQLYPSSSGDYLEGSLLYVDQTLVSSCPERALVITSLACVLWGLVGCSLSWSKLSITSTPGCGLCNETRILGYGIRLLQSNSHKFEVYIPDQKLDLILAQLECLISPVRIRAKELQSLLGRLQWAGEMFIFLKPHLRSLCANVSIAQRKGLRFVAIGKKSKIRSDAVSLISLLSGRSKELSVSSRLAWCDAQVEPITIVSDASTRALGGFVALCFPTPTVYYFRYDTSDLPQSIGTCMFRTFPHISSRDISALECLAASLALLLAKICSYLHRMTGMTRKAYAQKAKCAPVLKLLSKEIWQLGIPTGFFHKAGKKDHLADWLSRSSSEVNNSLDSFTLASVDHWLNELAGMCLVVIKFSTSPGVESTFGSNDGESSILIKEVDMPEANLPENNKASAGVPEGSLLLKRKNILPISMALSSSAEIQASVEEFILQGLEWSARKQYARVETFYNQMLLPARKMYQGPAGRKAPVFTSAQVRSLGVYSGFMQHIRVIGLSLTNVKFTSVGSSTGGCRSANLDLHRSKTDGGGSFGIRTSGRGDTVTIASIEKRLDCQNRLCPVHALSEYINGIRSGVISPDQQVQQQLFLGSAGEPLSYNEFLTGLHFVVRSTQVTTHSCRRTGTQLLFRAEYSILHLCQYGRWRSGPGGAVLNYLDDVTACE
ncbi:hypothetical protein FOL47_000902, partial [Perkinsus chesapeaki]